MEEKKKPTDIIQLDPIPELTTATEGLNNISSLADNILTTVSSWKQMERDMHQIDVQFNAYLAKLDADLEQYKISAPIVSNNSTVSMTSCRASWTRSLIWMSRPSWTCRTRTE